MGRLETINLFKDFLQKNNIDFNEFLLLNKNLHFKGYAFSLFENISDPCDFINYSFTWSETEQGHMYWKELHRKWNILYRRTTTKSLFED